MKDLVITEKGKQLISKMIAGTSTATFTKICTSEKDYGTQNLADLTALTNIKQTQTQLSVEITDNALVQVIGSVNNSDLTTGYYVRAIGLYAKDSTDTEILFGVSIEPENPDYMPAFGGKTVTGITYKINTKVDNSDQVSITISPSDAATLQQVRTIETKVTQLETDMKTTKETVSTLKTQVDSLASGGDLDERYQRKFLIGTTEPDPSLGEDGDVYLYIYLPSSI